MTGRRRHRDIEIRGTVYPDADAAAAALGVHPATVRVAVRRGTLHRVGLGLHGPEPMPVRVRGRVFADAGAAAAHFGVTRQGIYGVIGRGCEERYLRPYRRGGAGAVPVAIGVLRFASVSAAARALGVSRGCIRRAVAGGSARCRERVLAAAMAHAAENKTRKVAGW